jgi:hypothetical protein
MRFYNRIGYKILQIATNSLVEFLDCIDYVRFLYCLNYSFNFILCLAKAFICFTQTLTHLYSMTTLSNLTK